MCIYVCIYIYIYAYIYTCIYVYNIYQNFRPAKGGPWKSANNADLNEFKTSEKYGCLKELDFENIN